MENKWLILFWNEELPYNRSWTATFVGTREDADKVAQERLDCHPEYNRFQVMSLTSKNKIKKVYYFLDNDLENQVKFVSNNLLRLKKRIVREYMKEFKFDDTKQEYERAKQELSFQKRFGAIVMVDGDVFGWIKTAEQV